MTAQQIIEALGGHRQVAADLGQKPNTVLYWGRRGRIPAAHWDGLARIGKRHGITLQLLAAHAAFDRKEAAPC